MTAMLASGNYQWKSLGAAYQGNSAKGLTVAVAIHIVLIGLLYVLGPVDQTGFHIEKIIDIGGRPQWEGTPIVAPKIANGGGLRSAAKGIPVPVNAIDDIEENLKSATGSATSEATEVEGSGSGGFGTEEGVGGEESGFPGGAIDLTTEWKGTLEKYPVPIREVKPDYPELARRLGLEGTVTVKILIDKNGKPEKAEIYKGVNDLLNEAAMQAAMKWLFVPAVMNNYTVAVWVAVPFRFRVVER